MDSINGMQEKNGASGRGTDFFPKIQSFPVYEPGVQVPGTGFIFVKNPTSADLLTIYEMIIREIGPDVAPFGVVKSVYSYNPTSFWGIYRSPDDQRRMPKLLGFISYMPLNVFGVAALKANSFDARDPDLSFIARKGEEPTALYLWAIVAHGLKTLAGQLVAHALGTDLFERLPVFATVSTSSALRAVQQSSHVSRGDAAQMGSLIDIKLSDKHKADLRALRPTAATRDTPRPRSLRPQLESLLVSNADQMAKVMAIRAAVFMMEQNCPYSEEFDGNDYAGAQMLGLVNGEPAAVLRIRYFAGFVKLERLAVLPRFRRTLIAKQVIEHAIEICRRKGYRKMYGHAQVRLVPFWRKFGYEPMAKDYKLVFSDHEYVEIAGEITPHENPLTPESDPMVLIRPEGQWDRPGVLDLSAARPPTNPH